MKMQKIFARNGRMRDKTTAGTTDDHTRLLVECDDERWVAGSGRLTPIHPPSSMRCAEKLVHHGPVAGELGCSLVYESHPVGPSLFGFGDIRTLPPYLSDVLNEFWDVT